MSEVAKGHPAYDPELYALIHRGAPGDLHHYVRLCAGAREVLELGCGYGRVLMALARAGSAVTGVDRSPAMLEAAREQLEREREDVRARVTLVQDDMTRFELDKRFDRVLIPHNGLYCLLSGDEVDACLRRAHRHLARDGVLAFDAYVADPFHREGPEADGDWEALVEVEHRGTKYRVFERSDWHRSEQRLTVTYRYEPTEQSAAETAIGVIEQRYLLGDQLRAALDRAGFAVKELAGDFSGTAHDDASAHWVIAAVPKPG